uniref:Uncharacterized protein n=1 Tax=Anopheles quadriannulatus TaxID=34691 RepID=A0A182XT91_ANOQN
MFTTETLHKSVN